MNSHYTYLLILGLSLLGPLALSFDKKVAFYSKWRNLFGALWLPALFYIIWDVWFTQMGIWQFNQRYIIEATMVYNLPLEEILFFFVVPFCCVFIYECIRCYFPNMTNTTFTSRFLQSIGVLLLILAIMYHNRYYTFFTSLFNVAAILMIFIFRSYCKGFNITAFLVSYLISLIPFLIVNGFLTALPVVIYNDEHNLQLRLTTIPVEDIFYGMLLIMLTVVGYERRRTQNL